MLAISASTSASRDLRQAPIAEERHEVDAHVHLERSDGRRPATRNPLALA